MSNRNHDKYNLRILIWKLIDKLLHILFLNSSTNFIYFFLKLIHSLQMSGFFLSDEIAPNTIRTELGEVNKGSPSILR